MQALFIHYRRIFIGPVFRGVIKDHSSLGWKRNLQNPRGSYMLPGLGGKSILIRSENFRHGILDIHLIHARFPNRYFYIYRLASIIDSHNDLAFPVETAVRQHIIILHKCFQRPVGQHRIGLVYTDDLLIEPDQVLVFTAPGIRSPAVRVCKSTDPPLHLHSIR